jgi:flagellar motor switch protein FliG
MIKKFYLPLLLLPLLLSYSASTGLAGSSGIEFTKKTAENQIRHLLEPLLDKYCHESCRLMNVNVTVDNAVGPELAPGFDEELKNGNDFSPSTASIKLLIDDKVGPVSRNKLLELLQQFLDTLDYPVKIDSQSTHFPMPQGSEGKIGELREKIAKDFQNKTDQLLREFCQNHCLLTDFNLQTEVVNGEEAQYGSTGEFIQDGDTAIRIKDISATLLMDENLSKEEQDNILEMVRLKTNSYKHVSLIARSLKFPNPSLNAYSGNGSYSGRGPASERNNKSSSDSSTSESKNELNSKFSNESNSSDTRVEKLNRIERIEKVENGDIVVAEMQKLKIPAIVFAGSVLALLLFIAATTLRRADSGSSVQRVFQQTSDSTGQPSHQNNSSGEGASGKDPSNSTLSKRYEIERLMEELSSVYAQQPRVAKQVFSRILTEEGVEVTAECIHVFGEGIIIEMLRDPTLQTDLNELMEYYAKNPLELKDDEKLELLRKLHSRTTAGKLVVLGNRSTNLFDFLGEMDGLQILELIRTETITVKSIVLTQCDTQKRTTIYSQMDADLRMKVLTELSRIDYLPRDFIFNVAAALKRKKKENPKLNTEALPGSEVLVGLLERTGHTIQQEVLKKLEVTNPDSARTVKNKLVSTDTLKYLRDGQLLEVVLSLKHEELIPFLKGAPADVRNAIYAKSPKDLVSELEEELTLAPVFSRETYQNVERKVLNRMKVMANDGLINLIETNERMFADNPPDTNFLPGKAS